MKEKRIAFVGAGNIARALIVGLISEGYPPDTLMACNPSMEKLTALQQQFGIQVSTDNAEGMAHADVVVLAVKPVVLPVVCKELQSLYPNNKPLVISVAAGVTTALLLKWMNVPLPIVRAMPNTPVAVLAGATGLFADASITELQKEQAETLFRSVGSVLWLEDESDMDLVTAVSGSGPAYYFLMMEAMQSAANRLGLAHDVAHLLTLQTVLGAARLAMESRRDLTELRDSITPPNGTTEAATRIFREGHFEELVEKAMCAALNRSRELAAEVEGSQE